MDAAILPKTGKENDVKYLRNYITVDLQQMKAHGLSIIEWALMENIHFLSHNETGYCFAAKETIADHLGISRSGLFATLKSLVERDFLVKNNFGHYRATEKWIEIIAVQYGGVQNLDSQSKNGLGVQKLDSGSPKIGLDGVQKLDSKKDIYKIDSKKEKKDSKKEKFEKAKIDYSEDFKTFWEAYPEQKRVSKPQAMKAFEKAILKTDLEKITKALENYRKYLEINNTEEKFIKHPATWLNNECWNDPYTTQKIPQQSKNGEKNATVSNGFSQYSKESKHDRAKRAIFGEGHDDPKFSCS